MLTQAEHLETGIAACLPGTPCDVLVLDQGGLATDQGDASLVTDAWPEPWSHAHARQDTSGSQRVWWVSSPAQPSSGWPTAFPVWLAQAAGAQAMLILARAPQTQKGPRHLTDVVDLTQRSPLIGLGPSPRGPLFPDRTGVLDPELAQRVQALIQSTPAIAADAAQDTGATGDAGSGPWDLVLPGISAPLAAAAHVGLPAVALALGDPAEPNRSYPWKQIIQALLHVPTAL
ncbi:MAG: hypothetical protein OSB42_01240 [Planctomycetota bacterium]|nr:hypothetical protein [Planctomycetota bacterium]